MSHARRLALLCGVTAAILAGCGDTKSSDDRKRGTLTLAQAQQLSRVLYRNYEAKGAAFTVTIPNGPDSTVDFLGEVDWVRSRGCGTAQARRTGGSRSAARREIWTARFVLEPASSRLAAVMARRGRPGVGWLQRPLNPKADPLEGSMAFLNGLASDRPENALLLQQSPAAFVRRDKVGPTSVDVYRYGAGTLFWVGRRDGILRRVDTHLAGLPQMVVIGLSHRGPRHIAIPPLSERVRESRTRSRSPTPA